MKNKFVIVVLVFTIIIATIFVVGKFINLGRAPKIEIARMVYKAAPDFRLLDIYGSERKLSDFEGKVVILDFWATWCPPCKAEIPHFIELYDKYKDKGLEIIGVALDWNADKVAARFAEENNINYTILLGNRDVTDLYGGIMSIPTTFVIDRNGGIRKKYIGYRDKEVFEEDIKELL